MQQHACHLLSTAAVAAASTTTASSLSSTTATAMNYMGQSKILHLLGPPWTRTFRCIWMLEEINEEYYQQKQNKKTNGDQSYETSSLSSTQQQQQVPYYLIYNAKPLSAYVKKYHSTGKVPILLEYNDVNHQQQRRFGEDDDNSTTSNRTICNGHNNNNVFILSEASAINTYLYDQYGLYSTIKQRSGTNQRADSTLFSSSQQNVMRNNEYPFLVPPVGSSLRGQYDALISCICTELDAQGLWIHRKHDTMSQQLTGTSPNQPAVEHAKEHFKRINTYLAYLCNPYLLGAHFTAADILYIHCLQWSQSIGWSTDTWPTVDILPPINVNVKTSEDPSANNHPTLSPPPSILQPYLDLCLSRPAYQRAVQIRDGRGDDDRKDTTKSTNNTTNQTTATSSIVTGQVTTNTRRTTPQLDQWEQERNNGTRLMNYPTPKSKL